MPSLVVLLTVFAFAQETETLRLPLQSVEAASEPASVLTMEPVVVPSELEKQDGPAVYAPGNYLRVDYDQALKTQSRALNDVLKSEPGLEFTGGPRSGVQLPQIRGLGSERILILQDGVRQNFQSGHNGRVFLEADMIDSVEVVKGPWSSLYGSGALGGVISISRPTARTYIERTGRDSGLRLSAEGADADQSAGARLTAYGKSDGFEPLISVKRSNAGDVRLGGGDRLDFSASTDEDVYGSLGYEFGENHRLTVKGGRFKETSIQPLNPTENTTTPSTTADYVVDKEDIVADYRLRRGDLVDLHVRPSASKTEVTKSRRSDGRNDTQKVETVGLDVWNNFSSTLGESTRLTTTVGADHFRDRQDGTRNSGDLNTFADGQGSQTGVYVQPSFVFHERTKVTPGLRYDRYDLRATTVSPVANESSQLSGKLYVSHQYAQDRTVFAGYGQGFNAPRLQDLYASGLHFPPFNTFVMDPNLRPERSHSFELGSKNRFIEGSSALDLDGTVFYTEASDFIFRNVGPTTTRFENVDEVTLWGFEARTFYETPIYGMGLTYGQTRSRNIRLEEPLADTPADKWTGRLEAYLGDKLTVGTDVRYMEAQLDVADGAVTTPDAFTQDLYISYASPFDKGFSGGLRVNNMYDRRFRRHGNTIDEAGRDIRVDLSWLL